jgi:hypothetical protein
VGTLSGYIQHRDKDGRTTVYALTCRHVVDPFGILGNKPYVEDSGHREQQVTCPAAGDHKTTMQEINNKITTLQWATEFRNDINTTREITTLDQALKKAMQYNISLGHVYATSGLGRLLPQFQGRSDWAIMSITNPAISAENKVCNFYSKTSMIATLTKTNSMSVRLVRLYRLITHRLLRLMTIFATPLQNTSTLVRILSLFETMT